MSRTIVKPYREAQMQRRALIERGVPPWRVTACSTANLNDLDAEYQQLTLVPDVGRPALTVIDGGDDFQSPDEVFSTRFFLARMRGEATPDFPVDFDGLGGDAA